MVKGVSSNLQPRGVIPRDSYTLTEETHLASYGKEEQNANLGFQISKVYLFGFKALLVNFKPICCTKIIDLMVYMKLTISCMKF